jgi:hypothetical protein
VPEEDDGAYSDDFVEEDGPVEVSEEREEREGNVGIVLSFDLFVQPNRV